ncbi:MAG: magnesium transporter [Cellulomonas sp.]|uniref:magnesium transporter MgtE N-terminal domain-containing protein n=1 Tax=Cellulomonas sp. TaxID=40001 RepID=UPI00181CEAF5|nr:CBS domain-containing protein [Cellulomonas sp.]NMM29730.1 magnesium transporter [Cellulomonas sp.]
MTGVTNDQPAPATGLARTLLLSALLRRTAVDGAGHGLGRLSDIIVRLREDDYPLVTGLVADVGGRELFVPATEILAWDDQHLELTSARLDLRPRERRIGEVLLRGDVLGHRLVDVEQPGLVTAHDILLTHAGESWVATAVDIHARGLLRRRAGHTWRDWAGVEALIGHDGSLASRARLGGLRRLKPAQLADLIEDASDHEQHELLSRAHAHADLEADVFEELDEDQASDLLEARTDPQIADVLGRMRSDDAADALLDLPQERRLAVLGLLPEMQRAKITDLLGYQEATAGGLMSVDYLLVPSTATAAEVVHAVSAATQMQPEAIVVAFCHDELDRLVGAVSLVALIQSDPATAMADLAAPHPVHVHPDADLPEITLAMADYNLLLLPVLDRDDRLIGVLTIDDILEAAVAPQWRLRRG